MFDYLIVGAGLAGGVPPRHRGLTPSVAPTQGV